MQELSDKTLVERAQNGDERAVGELYDRHRTRIFRYVRARVYDTLLAQDLTGEIFLRMVANLPNYRVMEAPFTAWLYRIAHNYVINYSQKENRRQLVPVAYANNVSRRQDNPAVIIERQLELEWIQQGLERIDETQREVLILRFLVGLSLKEVAQTLDKTVAAVKSLQHRGVLALQVALNTSDLW